MVDIIQGKRNFLCGLMLLCLTVTSGAGCRITTPVVTPEKSMQKETPPTGEKLKTSGDDAYRVGPGDVLHVSVWGNNELTMDVVVRPDGMISLPLLQDVSSKGLTAEELRSVIAVRLKEFIVDPIVTITVKEVNYSKFYMMGEINSPGTYPLREKLTILQALSLAGGFTPFAGTSNIMLIRQNDPYQVRIIINYSNLIKSGAEDKNLYLQPGDTIVVP